MTRAARTHQRERRAWTLGVTGRMLRRSLGTAAVPCITGCLPRARINAACRWTGDEAALAGLDDSDRRTHLIEDVRVAKDLGIRYADASEGRLNTPAWHRAQASCTERSIAEIKSRHHVSVAEVTAAARAREPLTDLLAVFLPSAALFLVASRVLVARLLSEHGRKNGAIIVGVLAPVASFAAGVAVALTQMWGVFVEQLRLRSDHISYRAFELPASRHGWALWGVAMALFAASVVVELLRKGVTAHRRRREIR